MKITRVDLEAMISRGNEIEIRNAIVAITADKKEIEDQLSRSKSSMMERRSALIESGKKARDAQAEATCGEDMDWRADAVSALTRKDEAIQRLRLVLVKKEIGKVQKVVCYRGEAEEIVAEIQDRIDAGWYLQQMGFHDDSKSAAVICLWKGVP